MKSVPVNRPLIKVILENSNKSNSGKQLKDCKIKFLKVSNLPIGIYFFFKKLYLFNLFKFSKR